MSDLVKSLWGKLYAWALPSALALGAYWLIVYPHTRFGHPWLDKASETVTGAVYLGLVATLAFVLNAFSTPLYRILEGYVLWPAPLQDWGVRQQIARKKKLEARVAKGGWRLGLDLEELGRYPQNEDQITPTRFGNALRAFEVYGKTRYNLDSQSLWYELRAVAPKDINDQMQDARAAVDFFVAGFYLALGLAALTIYVALAEHAPTGVWIFAGVSVAVALVCHWLAVRTTSEWGYTVQALVNVGRAPLAKAMALDLPDTLEAEKAMWGLVTGYGYYADKGEGAKLDRYRKKAKPAAATSPVQAASRWFKLGKSP